MRLSEIHANAQASGFVQKQPLVIHISPQLTEMMRLLQTNGTPGLIVGGAVRDAIVGANPKDVDVEVYGTTFDALAQFLSQWGNVNLVGRKFGVLKLRTPDGQDFDFSVPRRDNNLGAGHKNVQVIFDPSITPMQAAARRDYTINSMAYDPLTSEIYDFYGGQRDLHDKVLRATSPAFSEDALRVLRGLQFATRFEFKLDPATAELSKQMSMEGDEWQTKPREELQELARLFKLRDADGNRLYEGPIGPMPVDELGNPRTLTYPEALQWMFPKDRVWGEWEKLLTKGKDYHAMFDYLGQTGWDKYFPEVSNMVGVPQEPEWHPEGDVHTHTAHVMQAAKEIAQREKLPPFKRLLLMTASLSHDFAKPATTKQMPKDGVMRWTSHGHEAAGGPMAQEFLSRLGAPTDLIEQVVPLVERHLEHIRYKGNDSKGMIRQFAHDIAPASIEDMTLLMEADHSGRPPLPKQLPTSAALMRDQARQEGVNNGIPPKLITGADVMPYYNNKGGPYIGVAVNDAYRAWLKGEFSTREEGLQWLDRYMRGRASLVRGDHVLPYFGGRGSKEVGNIMNDAWQAQRGGEFTDSPGASDWLQKYMKLHGLQAHEQPPVAEPDPAPVESPA